MTEAEWLACDQPQRMVDFLRGRASDRKLLLFAVSCYRHIFPLLNEQRSRNAVLVAENFIEGAASLEELRQSAGEARRAYDDGVPREGGIYHTNAALGATYFVCEASQAAGFASAYAAYAVGDEAVGDVYSCPEAYILYAAMNEASSKVWNLSVMSEASASRCSVWTRLRQSSIAPQKVAKSG